jgi:hypothetical protein
MKKQFWICLVLLFSASIWAEDLGEVAKKEKARREALKKQGKKATVLTNKDVENIKSSLGIESSSANPDYSAGSTPSEPAVAIDQAITDSNAQLDELKRQRAELTREVQDTSDSIQQSGVNSRNTGEQYRQKRLKEEELRKVEEQIEALEKQREEKAETAPTETKEETKEEPKEEEESV